MNVLDFKSMKAKGQKISMLTCYDYWSAKILSQTELDCLLVGDSVAMVMHGFNTTIQATTEMMVLHTEAVARGAGDKFIVGDMPFLSFRRGPEHALEVAGRLLRAGAHAVKLEGISGHEQTVKHLVESGIPVMGHLGLTPQSVHQLGGHKVQGRDKSVAQKLLRDAQLLESLGCFAVVLECVPSELAKEITAALACPTIGIGAGTFVDGQVLVLQDFLGAQKDFNPKFLKKYAQLQSVIASAVTEFNDEVKAQIFPSAKESYV